MKRNITTVVLGLLLTCSICAQVPNDTAGVTVSRIRKVAKSPESKNKSAIEITLRRSESFYVGNWYYCLQIGKLRAAPGNVGSSGNHTLVFGVSTEDWKALKNGDPLWLTWGCRQSSVFASLKPFAYLNKKLVGKK
jgi:hypothetical protein